VLGDHVPNVDNVPEFELARFVYEAQVQQLDRSATNAQGLLTALALLAAFSSPLVVDTATKGWAELVLGAGLVALFGSIAAAAYWTLRIVYVGRVAAEKSRRSGADEGWLYFGHIAQFGSASEFADHCARVNDNERVLHLYEQAWQLSLVVRAKSQATVVAVKWTLAALLAFLIVLVIRYLDLVL